MKKILALVLVVVIVLFAVLAFSNSKSSQSASTRNAVLRVSDNAFNMTPQQYINLVNSAIVAQGDSRYKTIPDFVESGEQIEICWINFTLALTTNEAGYISKFEFDWKLGSDSVNNTAPFVVGYTIGCICPGEAADAVFSRLDMMDTTSPKYNTIATSNGVVFDYDCFYDGIYSELVITPKT